MSGLILSGCTAAAPSPKDGQTEHAVASSNHIVIVANVHGPGEKPADIGYMIEEIESRGMRIVPIRDAADASTIRESIEEAMRALDRDRTTRDHLVALLAVGHDAAEVWRVLASPPDGLVAAVTVDVPGIPNLDFNRGLAVATLSLNLETDRIASDSHHDVHEAMSDAGVLHQVIVYGEVADEALDTQSPEWDEETAKDVALRAADWLEHRDGFSNQNMEDPAPHP